MFWNEITYCGLWNCSFIHYIAFRLPGLLFLAGSSSSLAYGRLMLSRSWLSREIWFSRGWCCMLKFTVGDTAAAYSLWRPQCSEHERACDDMLIGLPEKGFSGRKGKIFIWANSPQRGFAGKSKQELSVNKSFKRWLLWCSGVRLKHYLIHRRLFPKSCMCVTSSFSRYRLYRWCICSAHDLRERYDSP